MVEFWPKHPRIFFLETSICLKSLPMISIEGVRSSSRRPADCYKPTLQISWSLGSRIWNGARTGSADSIVHYFREIDFLGYLLNLLEHSGSVWIVNLLLERFSYFSIEKLTLQSVTPPLHLVLDEADRMLDICWLADGFRAPDPRNRQPDPTR